MNSKNQRFIDAKRAVCAVALFSALIATGCGGPAKSSSAPPIVFNQPANANPSLATLEDLGPLPDFKLTDQNGKETSLSDLKGKVWAADFFFTSCKGACPMMAKNMAQLQQLLSTSGLHLVSITVDPATDTPERLKEYAKEYGANEHWTFLTGDKSKIVDLSVKGFKLSASEEDPTTHSQRLILIDRNGHIRGYYRNEDKAEMEQLQRNALTLLQEVK